MSEEATDLYEVLGIPRDATVREIRKAYHKAALEHHPDKAPEHLRAEAEIRFKSVGTAYEILSDEQQRRRYDQHGISAFRKGAGGSGDSDLDGMEAFFTEMMSGFGGAGFDFPHPDKPQKPRKSPTQIQDYSVSLVDLYKGKTVRMAITKVVICSHCEGRGGRHKSKASQCYKCKGRGKTDEVIPIAPGLVTHTLAKCSNCDGDGKVFASKDKCRKCKGSKVGQTKKMIEVFIPRGSRDGDKILLPGEADQVPGQEPGDLVLRLKEQDHPVFSRVGSDLLADLDVALSEALCGFSRVAVTHFDDRGIRIQQGAGKLLKPGEIIRIKGEGMPHKKSKARGDLYLQVKIRFPDEHWLADQSNSQRLAELLPAAEHRDDPE